MLKTLRTTPLRMLVACGAVLIPGVIYVIEGLKISSLFPPSEFICKEFYEVPKELNDIPCAQMPPGACFDVTESRYKPQCY